MTMTRALLLSLLSFLPIAAACGGKPAATTTPANQGGESRPPALFDAGRSWTFDVKIHDSFWDDQDPDADANGNVNHDTTAEATCTVTGVEEVEGGKVSHIACVTAGDADVSGMPLAGDWFVGQDGLYKGAGDDKQMFLSASPVEASDDQEMEEGSLHEELTHKGDAWCRTSSQAMGDEAWESLCLGPDGPTEGTWGWAGGSVHENTFTLKAAN
jgi:hypothetical protein